MDSKNITNIKKNNKSKWNKITVSKYTIFFVLVSIIQAIVLDYLQYRMLTRNGKSLLDMYTDSLNKTSQFDENCFKKQFLPLYVLTLENLMFIFFYLFQLYFCFNAIFHENTIQIITIATINLAFIFIGIMQIFEVRTINNEIKEYCPQFEFNTGYINDEIFFIIVLGALAVFMGFLSFKLYRRFGWSIYKRIGGDFTKQKLYKTKLIFVMMLKLDLLMIVLFSGLLIPVFYMMFQEKSGFEKFLIFISTVTMILAFFFEALAYKALQDEWKAGMKLFIYFWIFALLVFAGLCIMIINLSVETKWYIGFIMGVICFSFSFTTLVYAVFSYRNFGRGLMGITYIEDDDDRKVLVDEDDEKKRELVEKVKIPIDD